MRSESRQALEMFLQDSAHHLAIRSSTEFGHHDTHQRSHRLHAVLSDELRSLGEHLLYRRLYLTGLRRYESSRRSRIKEQRMYCFEPSS